jgi:predicted HicB family RNase H-like nuclease
MEEKKSRYTEAQAKAAKKYLTEAVEEIKVRVPKGQKAIIKAHADLQGESMNQFIIRAIDETMDRDNNGK